MRISYTYQKYPNCPRATEYSQSAESTAAYGGMLIGPITIGAVIAFLVCTFSFFGNYNWGEFLATIVFSVVVAIIDFYYFVIRPNNTQCEIKVILTEEGNRKLPTSVVQQFCENLRAENRTANKKEFAKFIRVFLVCLFDAVAVIATIKGVYFLCHKDGGLFLLLGGIVAISILSYAIFKLLCSPLHQSTAATTPASEKPAVNDSASIENIDIAYCRKCGTKVLPDSVFCAKCGTKVR